MDSQPKFPYIYYDKSRNRYLGTITVSGKRYNTAQSRYSAHAYLQHCRSCELHGLPYDEAFFIIAKDISATLPHDDAMIHAARLQP